MLVLVLALGAFTVAALMGVAMAFNIFRGHFVCKMFSGMHALLAILGSALVIFNTLTGGDERAWVNIGMAVVILALGFLITNRRKKGQSVKGLVMAHGALAVACYAFLIFIIAVHG